MTAPRSLSDRDRAAAEKHTGRPAIASRTPIAPSGSRDQHRISGCATIATDPAVGGGAANRTRLFAPCRSTTAARPCRLSHRYRRRRLKSWTSKLFAVESPPAPPAPPTDSACAPTECARMSPLATSVTEPPEPPAPPSPATFSQIPFVLFGPPAPPWPPNEFVTSPNVARRPVLWSGTKVPFEPHRSNCRRRHRRRQRRQ